ncbi:MAG: carbohydrate-binding family 9-like protein [Sphingobacteriaceae bacterium]
MNRIQSIFLAGAGKHNSFKEISALLSPIQTNAIGIVPWSAFPYTPKANFVVAHGADCIFIKYEVTEKFVKDFYKQPNEPVYKDSCVEFFIAFEPDEPYYNFEFNYTGNCLAGFGNGKEERVLLSVETIKKIRTHSTVHTSIADSPVSWELIIVIPFDVFYFHTLESLNGRIAKVNFYKCGDDLPIPHFLVWNEIISPFPDFHLPDFFGEMEFV